jgi:hypothetical protein
MIFYVFSSGSPDKTKETPTTVTSTPRKQKPKKSNAQQVIDLSTPDIEEAKRKFQEENQSMVEKIQLISAHSGDGTTYFFTMKDAIIETVREINMKIGGTSYGSRRAYVKKIYPNRKEISFRHFFKGSIGHFPVSYDTFQYWEIFAMSNTCQNWVILNEGKVTSVTRTLRAFKGQNLKRWSDIAIWDDGSIDPVKCLASKKAKVNHRDLL